MDQLRSQQGKVWSSSEPSVGERENSKQETMNPNKCYSRTKARGFWESSWLWSSGKLCEAVADALRSFHNFPFAQGVAISEALRVWAVPLNFSCPSLSLKPQNLEAPYRTAQVFNAPEDNLPLMGEGDMGMKASS